MSQDPDHHGPTLLERVARGDVDAVPLVVDAYAGLVWRLVRRRLGPSTPEAEDVVQEVFTELWRSAPRFDRTRGAEAVFVATIAIRRATDAQRRLVRLARAASQMQDRVPAVPAPAPDRLQDPDLARALESLPDDERQAIWLRVHSGMTHEQIGAALGRNTATVRTWVFRGLRRLRASLNTGGPSSEDTQSAGVGGASRG